MVLDCRVATHIAEAEDAGKMFRTRKKIQNVGPLNLWWSCSADQSEQT